MANTITSSRSSRSDTANRRSQRRPRFAARRRLLLLFFTLVLVGAALLANYGPLEAYRDARARLEQSSTAVSTLEEQKAQLQSELGRLSDTGYLESLAREELTYTRPGEQLYIVTGLDEATGGPEAATDTGATGTAAAGAATDAAATDEASTDAAPSGTSSEAGRPGLFERALNAIRGLF
jgi:cell division protein FtsB